MDKQIFNSRHFKLWYFSISHSMLLIRSPKNNIYSTNIDICFSNVKYLDCPVELGEVTIEKGNLSDLEYIKRKIGKNIELSEITVLVSGEKRFYIVSSRINFSENQLDYMELPFDCSFMK